MEPFTNSMLQGELSSECRIAMIIPMFKDDRKAEAAINRPTGVLFYRVPDPIYSHLSWLDYPILIQKWNELIYHAKINGLLNKEALNGHVLYCCQQSDAFQPSSTLTRGELDMHVSPSTALDDRLVRVLAALSSLSSMMALMIVYGTLRNLGRGSSLKYKLKKLSGYQIYLGTCRPICKQQAFEQ
ncbi:unnamed protein product [Fasciola hepatica]|uniref:Uncharacterized protein n=1 Tax=Fasciola hepatica TaxID=6192 RepID=A0ABC9HF22_FASHE